MKIRTWSYGTQRRATVKDRHGLLLVLVDELGEGHLLVGTDSERCAVGDTGVLTFTRGGPLGGYWRFAKERSP